MPNTDEDFLCFSVPLVSVSHPVYLTNAPRTKRKSIYLPVFHAMRAEGRGSSNGRPGRSGGGVMVVVVVSWRVALWSQWGFSPWHHPGTVCLYPQHTHFRLSQCDPLHSLSLGCCRNRNTATQCRVYLLGNI